MAETLATFTTKTARYILDELKRLYRDVSKLKQKVETIHNYDVPRQYLAYTTSTITARSGTTMGLGTATLKYIPGVPGTATTISDFAGAAEIDVYNVTSSTVDSGRYIGVFRECGSGKWVVMLEDCSM